MAVAHKGSISMGLVLIPVGLYKTTVDNDIHFNQLDKEGIPHRHGARGYRLTEPGISFRP